eukprot:GHVR01140106.1.p1 GENE.GHVR01140106.1~~GHVR01140106.1.p1  ORF type:complete len:245 (+),score=66.00 GHVR01140106.1:27-761(+)
MYMYRYIQAEVFYVCVCVCVQLYWNTKITDKGVCAFLKGCRGRLKYLNISGCVGLTDTTAQTLVETQTHSLTHLNFTKPLKLTQVGAMCMFEQLTSLNTLVLYGCHTLPDLSFSPLSRLISLSRLDICGSIVSDNVFKNAVSRLVNVTHLCVAWCTLLGDATLITLSTHCNKLILLNIHGNKNITNRGVDALTQGCKYIEAIDINGSTECDEYTRDNNKKLYKSFPCLVITRVHDVNNSKYNII